jgi:hypothetical protein
MTAVLGVSLETAIRSVIKCKRVDRRQNVNKEAEKFGEETAD